MWKDYLPPGRRDLRSTPSESLALRGVEQMLTPCHAACERARMHDSMLWYSTVAYFEAAVITDALG